jgi:hypothetical protein
MSMLGRTAFQYRFHEVVMLYCFMAIEREGRVSHELCLVPDKVDPLAVPVKIDDLMPTDAAVFRIGQEEACTVTNQGGELIISAWEPALVYLTPNLSAFPGIRAKHVKVVKTGEKSYRTYYSKDKSRWEEWTPSRERV